MMYIIISIEVKITLYQRMQKMSEIAGVTYVCTHFHT